LNLPPTLLASLQNLPGFDESSFIESHHSSRQITSVRINPFKFDENRAKFEIESRVPWSSHGYYLKQRPLFTLDPPFHAGAYYVQDASSMFLEEAIRQSCDTTQPLRVLDLCAAPGGKSTLIQSVISGDSLLVSNEVIKTRANILTENITKWGAANVVVTNNDPKDFQRLPGFFDLVVVDAPCSGSGLFRKDPEAMEEWSVNNVALCSQRQQRILADVMEALKPGGILIYSTCSYSSEEDEVICDWLREQFSMKSLQLKTETNWGIVETVSFQQKAYGYRFYPDKVKGEGFFISVFKKEEGTFTTKEVKSRVKPTPLSKAELEIAKEFIQNPGNYAFIKWNNEILVIPGSLYESFLQLQATLYIKKAGVKMGTIIRNELVPDHELVLSTIALEKFHAEKVDEHTALDFLRRKDIKINTNARGWATINYDNVPLGLVKILANRINNYYPKEWRILNK
jgi:16S rRNA C967 or C1407 C5-methylase (RsmB/RsmF family)/NOL1/NOP2/fmu family ribosome biogenesis protein